MLDEAAAKILGLVATVGTILHQIITRDRARSKELQEVRDHINSRFVRKDQLVQIIEQLNRIESRVDKLYEQRRE